MDNANRYSIPSYITRTKRKKSNKHQAELDNISKKLQVIDKKSESNEDKMKPSRKGKEIANEIQGAKTHLIKDCGHMIMLEQADECLIALKKLFKNINFPN